jgi:hypothetical protein
MPYRSPRAVESVLRFAALLYAASLLYCSLTFFAGLGSDDAVWQAVLDHGPIAQSQKPGLEHLAINGTLLAAVASAATAWAAIALQNARVFRAWGAPHARSSRMFALAMTACACGWSAAASMRLDAAWAYVRTPMADHASAAADALAWPGGVEIIALVAIAWLARRVTVEQDRTGGACFVPSARAMTT